MPAGTIVSSGSLVSPGGQQGIPGPNAVSSDAGNQATFGSDSKIYVPNPTPVITSVRLRSFNAIGNPTFEIDQRNAGNSTVVGGSSWGQDRWQVNKNGMSTGAATVQQIGNGTVIPGTNFNITGWIQRITLTAQQPSLAAADLIWGTQAIEGPIMRELGSDVHSISILARSSVANLSFGAALRDYSAGTTTKSLTKLCTLGAANTWVLVTLPNLPIWAPGGAWSFIPGTVGYEFSVTLASGSTFMAPANDTWQNGNFVGALGQSNFAASPVNSTFDLAFIQHEPGALCTTPIDKPFTQNLDECLRYYCKSYERGNVAGTAIFTGRCGGTINYSTYALLSENFPKAMAVAPNVVLYSDTTGAANTVRNQTTGVDQATTNAAASTKRIHQFSVTGSAIGNAVTYHYTADTTW